MFLRLWRNVGKLVNGAFYAAENAKKQYEKDNK
jgi:hypothetical protein